MVLFFKKNMVCWNRYIPSSLFYHYKRNQSVLKICQFYGLDYFGSDRGKVTKKQNGKSCVNKNPPMKLTAKAPENGWLEYFLVSFWVSAYVQVRANC